MTIVATGMGAVSAVGRSIEALERALASGEDGLRPIRRFPPAAGRVRLGGLVPGYDDPRPGVTHPHRGLSYEFAIEAAREAWTQARLDVARPEAHRIALVVGISIGDDLYEPTPLEEITERLGDLLGIAGPRITVPTACTSSTNAIGVAMELLEAGVADLVIAGGTDVLTPEILAGFAALGVLSDEKCAPFSVPFGTTLGEGAGFLALESRRAAEARDAKPLVALLGYGLSADAFHETSPDPQGGGVARAIAGALAHAGLTPSEIGYVNAHGTGTAANDPAEWRALVRVFGDHAERLPVSSTKALVGHAQAAAGVLELLVTVLAMRAGALPPTLHFTRARPHGPADPVGQATPRPATYQHAVCSNSAFGGHNAAVVVGLPSSKAAAPRERRDVFVRGVGAVGARDTFQFEELVPTASPRGLDPSTRLFTAATALALADAGVKLRKADHERAGLIAGTAAGSPQTVSAFRASIEARGLAQLSAPAFARMVLNAPCGACAKLLALKGANSTIDTGPGSGLVALAYAAQLLATRPELELIVAGGYDEAEDAAIVEGAACATLGTSGDIRVAGWGLGGPGRFADAVEGALAMASLASTDHRARFGGPQETAPASSAMVALVAAVGALRRREHDTVLVGADGGRSATCAVILTTRLTTGTTRGASTWTPS